MEGARGRRRLASVPLELAVVNPDMTPVPEAAWPLTPAEPREVEGLLSAFATAMVGGAMVLFGLGGAMISATPTMGATRGMRVDRERQQRCMELGITPEELAALEQSESKAGQ